MATTIETKSGTFDLPLFLPDATRGVVRNVSGQDCTASGCKGLMVNTLHLMQTPGISVIQDFGGIHRFMSWPGLIMADSGGFQIYSLLVETPNAGTISSHGFVYTPQGSSRTIKMTPQSCIQKQMKLGADILWCLDYCTHPDADNALQRLSVEYTLQWAKLCKEEFDRQVMQRKYTTARPLLFAVVQGGNSLELRTRCIQGLMEIGFDGYGFGGWPVDKSGCLLEMVSACAERMPTGTLLHGLGIGKPENVVAAFRAGYQMFDCVIPTRDGRHKRLFTYSDTPESVSLQDNEFYTCVYMQDDKHIRSDLPVDAFCDCYCCKNFSRGYLHHLFAVQEGLALRLATMHNLRFYSRLMELCSRKAFV
ncbi:MAG: queuine tRNA-ribosyltransferase family protein [Chitinivibrionales bacterium]|nr:queuine tRNA-ribosyltransferase family protein [Chitinivibrionales bacterium]